VNPLRVPVFRRPSGAQVAPARVAGPMTVAPEPPSAAGGAMGIADPVVVVRDVLGLPDDSRPACDGRVPGAGFRHAPPPAEDGLHDDRHGAGIGARGRA